MSDNLDALKARAFEEWDTGSGGWIRNADLIDRLSAPIREWIVDRLGPQLGETVLELACGAGNTGFDVARRIGDTGRLIQTDISPAMVEATTQRAKAAGLSNIDFRVMDAQSIELEDGSVDGVVHRYGPMLLPDPDASFHEVRRVLRDGGRYATAVWASPDRNPWVMITGMAVMQNGIELPGDPFGPGGMFSLSDPEVFKQRVADAGFGQVDVELVENPFEFSDFDQFWKQPSEIAGPIAVIIAKQDPDMVAAIKESYRSLAEPFLEGDRYRPPALTVCLSARA